MPQRDDRNCENLLNDKVLEKPFPTHELSRQVLGCSGCEVCILIEVGWASYIELVLSFHTVGVAINQSQHVSRKIGFLTGLEGELSITVISFVARKLPFQSTQNFNASVDAVFGENDCKPPLNKVQSPTSRSLVFWTPMIEQTGQFEWFDLEKLAYSAVKENVLFVFRLKNFASAASNVEKHDWTTAVCFTNLHSYFPVKAGGMRITQKRTTSEGDKNPQPAAPEEEKPEEDEQQAGDRYSHARAC